MMMYSVLMKILERLDPDTSGIQSTLCDHSFHCSCVSKWTFLSCTVSYSPISLLYFLLIFCSPGKMYIHIKNTVLTSDYASSQECYMSIPELMESPSHYTWEASDLDLFVHEFLKSQVCTFSIKNAK